jgi:hypothetical protein
MLVVQEKKEFQTHPQIHNNTKQRTPPNNQQHCLKATHVLAEKLAQGRKLHDQVTLFRVLWQRMPQQHRLGVCQRCGPEQKNEMVNYTTITK